MKKKYILMGVAGALVAATVIGGTLAALNTNTEGNAGTGIAEISTNAIGISLTGEGTTKEELSDVATTPGGDVPCAYYVTNNVSSDETGYSIYAKVTIYKSWEDDSLDASNATIDYLANDEYIPYASNITDMKNQVLSGEADDWIVAYADEEQIVLYYTKPLAQGESSSNFMDAISFASDMNNAYADGQLNLSVEISAVQINTQEEAMQAEWGVFPAFDANGNITGIYETAADRDASK